MRISEWARIPPVDEVRLLRAAACDWRLSRGDVGVFAVILGHCNVDLSAFPGPTRIAAEARLSVTSVKLSIRKLEESRYLAVERPGPRKKNRFTVLPSPAILPRKVVDEFEQAGLTSSSLGKRGTWSRAVRQPNPNADGSTSHARRVSTRQPCLQRLGNPARHEVALKALPKSQDAKPWEKVNLEEQEHSDARRKYEKLVAIHGIEHVLTKSFRSHRPYLERESELLTATCSEAVGDL